MRLLKKCTENPILKLSSKINRIFLRHVIEQFFVMNGIVHRLKITLIDKNALFQTVHRIKLNRKVDYWLGRKTGNYYRNRQCPKVRRFENLLYFLRQLPTVSGMALRKLC